MSPGLCEFTSEQIPLECIERVFLVQSDCLVWRGTIHLTGNETSFRRRDKIMLRILSLVALFLYLPGAQAQQVDPVPSVLSQLKELEPLPKVHYSWPLPYRKMSDDLLHEYVRITHAASLSGEWGNPDEIDRTVEVCHRVNADQPKIPASIGINYSVWHRRFGKELPPTDVGSTHLAELDYLAQRLEFIRDEVEVANRKHDSHVLITAILFDSERFHTHATDPDWNKAMTQKYDAAYEIARRIFPGARIEWYSRGSVQPSASATGWSESTYFSLDEKGESFGCSLYQVPEIGYTREIFRRTVRNAEQHGCEEVTPWISLASGYRRQTDKYHEFSVDWNYDLIYSWQLGAEINHPWFGAPERHERFAPWSKARIAIFYPEPFGRSPHYPEHFIAYVRGAHLIKSLPGD
jgi:hypothetical protein